MKLVIVSGLSGSGKSTALHALEDLGYYCIDNLPFGMLSAFTDQLIAAQDPEQTTFAVGIDARNLSRDLGNFDSILEELRGKGIDCDVICLQAQDDELIKRFSETRRRHPLTEADVPLKEALAQERRILDPILTCADLTIDTTHTNVHQLRDQLVLRLANDTNESISIQLLSFGFKHGLPTDADFVFDVRCLPNPHWVPDLRGKTGQDKEVVEFLEQHNSVHSMCEDVAALLEKWLPEFEADRRSYVTIAVGCTGGQHRSVYVIEKLASRLADKYPQMLIRHREL